MVKDRPPAGRRAATLRAVLEQPAQPCDRLAVRFREGAFSGEKKFTPTKHPTSPANAGAQIHPERLWWARHAASPASRRQRVRSGPRHSPGRSGSKSPSSRAKAEPWVPRMKRGMTVESWRTRLPAHVHAPPRAQRLPRRNTLPQTTPLRGHTSPLEAPSMQVRATKITTPKTTRRGGAWSGVRAH